MRFVKDVHAESFDCATDVFNNVSMTTDTQTATKRKYARVGSDGTSGLWHRSALRFAMLTPFPTAFGATAICARFDHEDGRSFRCARKEENEQQNGAHHTIRSGSS